MKTNFLHLICFYTEGIFGLKLEKTIYLTCVAQNCNTLVLNLISLMAAYHKEIKEFYLTFLIFKARKCFSMEYF